MIAFICLYLKPVLTRTMADEGKGVNCIYYLISEVDSEVANSLRQVSKSVSV